MWLSVSSLSRIPGFWGLIKGKPKENHHLFLLGGGSPKKETHPYSGSAWILQPFARLRPAANKSPGAPPVAPAAPVRTPIGTIGTIGARSAIGTMGTAGLPSPRGEAQPAPLPELFIGRLPAGTQLQESVQGPSRNRWRLGSSFGSLVDWGPSLARPTALCTPLRKN